MTIRTKLLLFFLSIGIIPFIVMGVVAVNNSGHALSDLMFSQLQSLRDVKKVQITTFFTNSRQDMKSLIATVAVFQHTAFEKMYSVQEIKKAQVEELFQKILNDITVLSEDANIQEMGNFTPILDGRGGVKDALYQLYEDQYFGASLRQFVEKYGYADLLLITQAGDVVYTTGKAPDLGQNLLTGDLRESGLAACFQQALRDTAFHDFEPYSPADNAYMAFAGAPVMKFDQVVGVVALRIDSRPFNTIIQRRQGMGETGESYLVGRAADGTAAYRSDRVVKNAQIGDLKSGDDAESALSGRSGATIKIGSTEKLEISKYDGLDMPGLNWGMITTMSFEEAITPRLAGEQDDFFAKFIALHGFSDLFLIHPEGNVFYSVAHHDDYGSNMLNGPYRESGLGQLVRTVLETKQFGFADFQAYAPSQGQPFAFMAQPVLDSDNEVELIVALKVPIDGINQVMQQRSGMGKSGETYLVGADNRMRSNSFLDPERYSVTASFEHPEDGSVATAASKAALAGRTGEKIIPDYRGVQVLSAYTPLTIEDTTWALLAEIDEEEAFASITDLKSSMGGIAVLAIVSISLLALLFTRYLTKRIHRLVSVAGKVAEGDLSESFEQLTNEHDEIGALMRTFRSLVDYFRDMAGVAARIAEGDLEHNIVPRSERDLFGNAFQHMTIYLQDIALAANAMAEGDLRQEIQPKTERDVLGRAFHQLQTLRTTMSEIMKGSEQLSRASALLTQISTELASGTEQSSQQVQVVSSNSQQISENMTLVSAATEEMNTSIREISSNVSEVSGVVQSAVSIAGEANSAIKVLEERSHEIGDIIAVITEITQQTNLLALNATIEAARVGDQGKGFAVVAGEVKELAKETASSTEDITGKIIAIQTSTAEVSRAITRVMEITHQVSDLSTAIAAAIDQQAATTGEISRNIFDAAQGSDGITHAVSEVADASIQASEQTLSVQQTALELAELSEQLHRVVGKFTI